ncbi:MAG: tetratricopeptide repeat protein [Nostoc sp.]|uniref:tetratricopeptide repeat protein n=1 Tax=Nostoc sp. TaxID=1180 RepID=UPI002FF3A077
MSGNLATYLVQFPQPSGVEMNVHLVLDEKPTRQDQKLKTLSKYIQKYPQGWKKRLELADLLYTMGSWEQAIAEYRQVIERSPQLLNVRLQLGKILQMMKREAEAIEVYGSALPLSSNRATQHHIGGLIAVCKGDTQKAIIAFDSAADLEPDKIVHCLALGQVQKGRENPIGALRAFSRVLSLNSDDIVALIHSYDALMAMGDFQEARQKLSRAIALAPDDFRVLQRQLDQRCGMRLVSGEEGKQTKKLIGSVLRQTPHAAEAYKSLAYYHLYRGDWAQGVGVLAEFTEEHPNNPSGWYYYGQCLFHTGENQAAGEMMLKAYSLYPDDCEIYRALCKILPIEPHPLRFSDEESIRFDRKYTVLVANKTGKTLQRVGAYNDSSNWPLGDIDPNTAAGQQFDGIPITNSFSFASNYRIEPGKNVQLAATFPTIGRRKIGLGGINQDGSTPAKQVWDNTNDANDKAVNNPPVEGRASIQQKDGSIIWYYEVK